MREFSVCLRIFSKTLSPEDISRAVGITATYARPLESTGSSQREHVWEYQLREGSDEESFSTLVDELLRAVIPFADGLRSIQKQADLILWCACFADAEESTTEVTKESIVNMANLGIAMSISYYYGSD